MTPTSLRVIHVAPRVQARGGIESILALHRQLPQRQAFVALFDRNPPAEAGYVNLNLNWRTPLWEMRRRFARAMSPQAGGLVVYHNGWGMPLFHDLDGASRRLLFLHANPAYHAIDLPAFAGLVDGAIGVTPALVDAWNAMLPELTAERGLVVRGPMVLPALPVSTLRRNEPLVLGYAGRIERTQKRLDRLPALLRELKATGLPFRFEVLGDGGWRSELEKRVAGQVRFHGWKIKADYWRILAGWDAIVFFSDFEGGSLAVFEVMAMGGLPFFPAIGGSWSDCYTPQVDLRCHYPPGDMHALAAAIREVFSLNAEQLAPLRRKACALVEGHRVDAYETACRMFMNTIADAPRISAVRRRSRRITDLLPLGLATRMAPWALRRS